jgi:hypothetical protein
MPIPSLPLRLYLPGSGYSYAERSGHEINAYSLGEQRNEKSALVRVHSPP